MGQRGPAKRPAKLRLIDGARPSEVNQREPIPMQRLPEPPDDLAPEVREVWDRLVVELDAMGIASSADRDSLVCLCEAVIVHRRASELLAGTDVLMTGVMGTRVRNPALQIQRDAAATIRAFSRDFGLSPSARAGIETNPADQGDNPFAG